MNCDTFRFFEGGDLPSSYERDGVAVLFRTNFRVWLRYCFALTAPGIDSAMRHALARAVCVERTNTNDPAVLAVAMAWFHSCGDTERMEHLDIPPNVSRKLEDKPRTSSLYWDAWPVWASFKQQHGIDLFTCGGLHWWEFKRLLGALREDTPLRQLERFRSLTSGDFAGRDGKMTAKTRADWEAVKVEQLCRSLPERRGLA